VITSSNLIIFALCFIPVGLFLATTLTVYSCKSIKQTKGESMKQLYYVVESSKNIYVKKKKNKQ